MSSIKYFFTIILAVLFIPILLEYFFSLINNLSLFFLSNIKQLFLSYGNLSQPLLLDNNNIFFYLLDSSFSIIFYIVVIAIFILVIKIVGDILG